MHQVTKSHRHAWGVCLAVLVTAALAASVTAKGAAVAQECVTGDVIHMMDPVVTVIEGPGDPAMEQERWAKLANAYLQGPLSVALGETTFDLETVP
jgi:hypothetical protein